MRIPRELHAENGALEIRMPLTPEDVEIGKLNKYNVLQNTGIELRLLASISIRQTESGYEILRRFNLKGQKPSRIGHTYSLDDAERAAYSHACRLASQLPSKLIPTYDLVESDEEKLEEKLKEKDA